MVGQVRFNHFRRIMVFIISSLLIFILLLFRSDISRAAVPQSTPICGEITTDATWTVAGNPYVICVTGATILKDATLTIEPGVSVEFDANGKLNVAGTLNAIGSSTLPITFTSSSGSPTPASWQGIVLDSIDIQSAVANLNWVILEYGGLETSQGAQVYIDNGSMTMTHSIVRFGGSYGVYVYGDLNPLITDSQFQGNARAPIHLLANDDLLFRNLSATGNGQDVIEIGYGSYTSGDHAWQNAGIPYLIAGSTANQPGSSLTVEPGTQVMFTENMSLDIGGTLNAVGLPDQPITFTAQTPTPGFWSGIQLWGDIATPATARFEYVTIEYGGLYTGNGAQVYMDHGSMTMIHSTVRFGAGYGVYVYDGINPQITDSLFQGNARYPLWVSAADDLRFHNLSAIGNGQDVIGVSGYSTMRGDRTWQDAGISYLITGSAGNLAGDSLTVEPGIQVLFAAHTFLDIGGTLNAVGLPSQPITFTAQTPTPGFWDGIEVQGDFTTSATARFEYVSIEYGGSGWNGANLVIHDGQVQMRHSIVRYGGNVGIRNEDFGFSRTLVEASQIVDNTTFGLENLEPDWPIMANNNWWGDPNGPQFPPGSACNQGGTGNMVSDGVIVYPVLASPTALPVSPSADSMSMVSIKPLRWFVPATGVDRLYVEITLRDGNGVPIAGATVHLGSSLGWVVDGGVTGFDGKTLAYVTSTTAGDAVLNPILSSSQVCLLSPIPTAKVTFTPATADEGYLPDSQAPYLNTGIEMDPLPITQGVPTKLSISVTNPNDFPIIVDGSFYYVQNSIGLAFGPLAEVLGTQIPAKGQAVIQVMWVPPLSGKYCIRFEFTARSAEVGLLAAMHPMGAQRNLNVAPGPKHSPEVQNAYDTSRKAVSALGNASDGLTLATDPAGFIGGYIPGYLFGHIIDFWYDTMDKIDKALNDDPPRQDYTIISLPEAVSFTPLQAGTGVSQAKADAANARTAAALDMFANLRVAALANDRYGGANQAKKIQWASLQLGALLYYEKQAALQMPILADAIDAYVAVVLQENPGDIIMTADIYQAYQERLQTQGFNSDELAAAHLLGMTDTEIEEMRQQYLALDPASVAGSVTQRLTAYAQTLRDLSYAILNPAGSVFIGGSHGMAAQADTPNDHLARLFAMDTTILVGNPYTQTETVDLVIRPIDLPPDWLVTISPSSHSLAAGESITVTVHISAGSPAPQGANPSFAVEGYIGSDLIGGTVIDTFVPFFTNFDGKLRIFIPLAQR